MEDIKKFGTNRYYLVTTNRYAGQDVNYNTMISKFDFDLNEFEGKAIKITSFSDKMLGTNKKIKKLPLAVIDMLTTKFKNIVELLEAFGDDTAYSDRLYDTYVGYFQKNYYAANPAVFDDEVLHHIASEVRSKSHRTSKSTQTIPIVNLQDELTNEKFRYLRHQLLTNKDFANYYRETANQGPFNRVDTGALALLNEYWRYKTAMSYGTNLDAAENIEYARADLNAEMTTYKTFRTIYLADKAYKKQSIIDEIAAQAEELKRQREEKVKVKRKTKNMPDPNQISLFDLDYKKEI